MPNPSQTSVQSLFARLPLRRIITSNRFIPEVDGFRFLAIVIVVFSHVYVQCGPIPGGGAFANAFRLAFLDGRRGVYLFFTISGFILGLPFARHHLQQGNKVNVRSYFKRRLTRLEPPYVLAMLLRVPLILVYKHSSVSTILLHLLASLLYVHSVIFSQYSTINPPAWSLEVEVQFYLLAPLLTGIFLVRNKQLRRAFLIAGIVIAGVIATTLIAPYGRLSLSLLYYLQYFLAGFLLCDFYLADDRFSTPTWLWDVIGFLSIAWILYSQAAWYPIALPFATIALYMAGFRGGIVRALFSFGPISIIGGMCYSLYLTHSTVLAAVTPLVHRLAHSPFPIPVQFILIFSLCFAAVLLAGLIYFVLIERPCMDPSWPHKLAVKLGRA
jgi:peptidoglycan/LPS O-acetylase OafA/YrhL